jgi:hypothetical protein
LQLHIDETETGGILGAVAETDPVKTGIGTEFDPVHVFILFLFEGYMKTHFYEDF